MRASWLFFAGLCACSSEGEDASARAPLEPSGAGGATSFAPGAAGQPPSSTNGGTTNPGGGANPNGAGAGNVAGSGSIPGSAGGANAGPPNPNAPPSGPLPDLQLDAAYLVDTTIEDRIETDDQCLMNEGCVTGLGERRVVRFGSRMGNLGTAPFELGSPQAGNPFWSLDSCHEAYELVGFAHYELLDAATGAVVLTGAKNGYCIRDSEPWQLDVPNVDCYSYNCTGQGITPGCADNYGSELQCQWIDITGVAPGSYTLRVLINASQAIPELDYSNNGVDVSLTISDDAVVVVR
jgi:hypothetical protein